MSQSAALAYHAGQFVVKSREAVALQVIGEGGIVGNDAQHTVGLYLLETAGVILALGAQPCHDSNHDDQQSDVDI